MGRSTIESNITARVWIDRLGSPVIRTLNYTENVLMMIYLSIRVAFYEQVRGLRLVLHETRLQIYLIGWQSLPLISILAVTTGMITLIHTASPVTGLTIGQVSLSLLYIIVIKEVGPIITSLVLIARSGTAIASDVGRMRVYKEIAALKTLAIDPYSYVAFPRIVAGVVSICCLSLYFDAIAILAGAVTAWLLNDMPVTSFIQSFAHLIEPRDLLIVSVKNVLNGLIIFPVCCYQGFQARQSAYEVPIVTSRAVLISITVVTLLNLLLTAILSWFELTQRNVL